MIGPDTSTEKGRDAMPAPVGIAGDLARPAALPVGPRERAQAEQGGTG